MSTLAQRSGFKWLASMRTIPLDGLVAEDMVIKGLAVRGTLVEAPFFKRSLHKKREMSTPGLVGRAQDSW